MKSHALATLVTLAALPFAAAADPVELPPELFAQLPAFDNVVISPDGKAIAYFIMHAGKQHIGIAALDGSGSVLVPPPTELRVRWLQWANDEHLVVAMEYGAQRYLTETLETRLLVIGRDGKSALQLIKPATRFEVGSRVPRDMPPAQIQDDVVNWLPREPNHILVSLDADHDGRFEVRKIDLRDASYDIVHPGLDGAQHYDADPNGELRFAWGYKGEKVVSWYRPAGGEWSTVIEDMLLDDRFTPLGYDMDKESVYVYGPGAHGTTILGRASLNPDQPIETIFENASVDFDSLLVDTRDGRPVGYSYITDMPHDEYFDEQMSILQHSLDAALPGASNRIVDVSDDGLQVIIRTQSPVDAGAFYHWNRERKSLDFLGERMPGLPPESLSPKQPVSYKARDGQVIPAYLTLPLGSDGKQLPAVVVPHGGPTARDDMRFDFLAQFLASRGYAVLQPNFRGSSGYGKAFETAGDKQWGGLMQDDVTDGVRWLVAEGTADPERVCIVGSSYGGYAAMMGAATTPDLYACAASINGVLDLARLIIETKDYIGGRAWVKQIGLDGERVKSVSPYHLAEQIDIPVLLVHAEDDVRVPIHHATAMAKRLEKLDVDVEFVELESGGHGLNDAEARRELLYALEAFLGETLAPPSVVF